MEFKNDNIELKLEIINNYTIGSNDNIKDSMAVLNPGSHKDYYSAIYFEVLIENKIKDFILIGAKIDSLEKHIVEENNNLIILMNNEIMKIDLYNLDMLNYIKFNNLDNTFELHKLNNKYIIYGELYIRMLNNDLSLEWEFSSDDIINSFKIEDKKIKLSDCNGTYYELDFKGKVIKKYFNQDIFTIVNIQYLDENYGEAFLDFTNDYISLKHCFICESRPLNIKEGNIVKLNIINCLGIDNLQLNDSDEMSIEYKDNKKIVINCKLIDVGRAVALLENIKVHLNCFIPKDFKNNDYIKFETNRLDICEDDIIVMNERK